MPGRARYCLAGSLFSFWISLVFGAQCRAATPGDPATTAAVQRGLQFLQKEAFSWRETRKCAACHHAATMIWTFNEAKAAGYTVDEKALKEVTEWTFGEVTNSLAIQAPPRDVVNLGWVYTLLAMETAPQFAFNPSGVVGNPPDPKMPSGAKAAIIQSAQRTFIERI